MLQETLAEKIPIWQNDLKKVLDQNGDKVISSVTVSQAIKGMRGVKSLICDTSTVSADKGLIIRGHSILDITNIFRCLELPPLHQIRRGIPPDFL